MAQQIPFPATMPNGTFFAIQPPDSQTSAAPQFFYFVPPNWLPQPWSSGQNGLNNNNNNNNNPTTTNMFYPSQPMFCPSAPPTTLSFGGPPAPSSTSPMMSFAAPRLCHYFFDKQKECRYGDACFYSHDLSVFMTAYNLKQCPNDGCDNYCRGRQCKSCHQAMVTQRRQAVDEKIAGKTSGNTADKIADNGAGADKIADDGAGVDKIADDGAGKMTGHEQTAARIPRQQRGATVANARVRSAASDTKRNDKRKQHETREVKECKGFNCTTKTPFRLCKECYEVESQYVLN